MIPHSSLICHIPQALLSLMYLVITLAIRIHLKLPFPLSLNSSALILGPINSQKSLTLSQK
jgi:hypothetical protein